MASQSPISSCDIATLPPPGTSAPSSFTFTTINGRACLLYLAVIPAQVCKNGVILPPNLTLLTLDLDTLTASPTLPALPTPAILSLSQSLKLERLRVHAQGVTAYLPQPNSYIIILTGGAIYAIPPPDRADSTTLQPVYLPDDHAFALSGVTVGDSSAADVTCSWVDGKCWVFWSAYNQLFCTSLTFTASSMRVAPVIQLTSSAVATSTNGIPDFLASEEMDLHVGYWLSPAAAGTTHLTYLAVDNSPVPNFVINHDDLTTETHHYPFAGKDNPTVTLRCMDLKSLYKKTPVGPTASKVFKPPPTTTASKSPLCYIARVTMLKQGVVVQWEARDQRTVVVQYVEYVDATGAAYRPSLPPNPGGTTVLRVVESESYVNLHHMFRVLEPPPSTGQTAHPIRFLYAGESSGFLHLWEYSGDGELQVVRQVTGGSYVVDKIVAFDGGRVYFECSYTDCKDRVLCVAKLGPECDTDIVVRVTERERSSSVVMDLSKGLAIITTSAPERPMEVKLWEFDVSRDVFAETFEDAYCGDFFTPLVTLKPAADLPKLYPRFAPSLVPPEFVTFENRCGTNLEMCVYMPDSRVHQKPYPVIVSVYGGPHVQRVARNWGVTNDLRAQRLRDAGYVVARVDGRGSARRGVAFETSIKDDLGNLEVEDQADAVEFLVHKFHGDADRVGIYGWSYGGYLSLACLMRASEVFHVAVAGAPVTDWDGYDTHYTERYMSTPALNEAGYNRSSIMSHVDKLKEDAKVLLIHGLIDENVHFRHTSRLITKMVKCRKKYDLLLFPEERHSPRKMEDREYMEERIFEYFETHLKTRNQMTRRGSGVKKRLQGLICTFKNATLG